MNEMFVKRTCFKQVCQLLLSLIVAFLCWQVRLHIITLAPPVPYII